MKKFILRLCLMVFATILFQGCKKDMDRDPEVQTLEITALSPSRAKIKGNIVNKGDYTVLDHGFIYGISQNLDENTGTKVSLGKDVQEGIITKEVQGLNVSNYDHRLYARTYLTNNKGTAYGQVISVQLPTPTYSSISPASGKVGDQITINGHFFTTNKEDVGVTFGNVNGKIIEVSETKIVVEVPSGINSNNQVSVVVYIGGQQILASYSFIIKPTIKDFSPKSGPIGTIISFSGENLPSYYYPSNYRVFFGQTEGYIPYYNSVLQSAVPNTVTTDKMAISVIIDGVTTVLPGEFTVIPPAITSISPTSGLPGSAVTVNGSNFPTAYNNLTINIGSLTLSSYTIINSNQLSFAIPELPPGDYTVSFKAGPHTVVAPQQLKIQAPSISSFSPTSGAVGREITVQGVFLPNQYYTVYFGSISTSVYCNSSSTLKVNVPYGVNEGKVTLSLKYGNQTVVAAGEFTVLVPTITSFSPSSGVAGTVVTITGEGFSPSTWNTSVKFGTFVITPISVTENSIRVAVPSNLNLGAMKLSVVSNGQTAVSIDNFTVTN